MSAVVREHAFIPVAQAGNLEIHQIPGTVIELDKVLSFDLGALCFRLREARTKASRGAVTRVEKRSIDERRLTPLLRVAQWFQKMSEDSVPMASLKATARIFTGVLDWCDEHQYHDVLNEKRSAQRALEQYFGVYVKKVADKEVSLVPARRAQLGALKLFQIAFADEAYGKTLKAIWVGNRKDPSVELTASGVAVRAIERLDELPKKLAPDLAGWTERRHLLLKPHEVDALVDTDFPSVVLALSETSTIDVGAFCFILRLQNSRTVSRAVRLVDESSFDVRRVAPVRRLLAHICDRMLSGGTRHTTMLTQTNRYFTFFDFCDAKGYQNALFDVDVANAALVAYFSTVFDDWRKHSVSAKHARRLQCDARSALQAIYEDDDLGHLLIPIIASDRSVTNTSVPDESDQGKVLALCQSLFDGFFELSYGFAPFPFRLELPRYLPWPRHYLWIFAKQNWYNKFVVPSDSDAEDEGHVAYDYNEGRIKTIAEAELACNPGNAKEIVKKAQSKQRDANLNRRDAARLRAASIAHNVFFLQFLANTNMNFTDARELSWSDDYGVETERQNFRTIKWRAGGKECKFEIESAFLPAFKKFLQIRGFILNGLECGFLFVSLGRTGKEAPHMVGATFLTSIYNTLRLIDPDLNAIMSRQLRVKKADFAISRADLETTAGLLQNSPSTLLKNYTAGSETKHLQEMSAFFDAFSEAARLVVARNGSTTAIPAGNCSEVGRIEPLDSAAPIEVSCRKSEGCLFCKSFRLHADGEDARKILSCMQYVQFMSVTATDKEEIDSVYEKVLERGEQLLNIIEQHSPGTVESIRDDVDEGNLTVYWQAKVEMLRDVGVI